MTDAADYFSAAAAGYAEHRPTYPAALVEFLAGASPAHDLAWDCGCGSGQLAVPLAARFAHVAATDASAAQLARAIMHPRVAYRRATAAASGLEPASVDLATAAQAVHWFDLEAYVREIRRVARPGAVVAWITYGPGTTGDEAVDRPLRTFHAGVLAPYWPPERAHVDDGYRRLPFPFAPIAVPALAIERDWTVTQFLDYVNTWSAIRRLEATGTRASLDAFASELVRAWGAPPARRRVLWPLAIRAGRV